MKRMKKIIPLTLACTLLGSTLAVGLTGCKNVANGAQDLEIYACIQGYGIEVINTWIDEFKKQNWVKEKYPDLTIKLNTDDLTGTGNDLFASGANYNTTDVILGGFELERLYDGAKKGAVENITQSVYYSEVPGEGGITVAQKMMPNVLEQAKHGPESLDEPTYYSMPYVAGMMGIIYNETLLNRLSLPVPVTTDEFVEECAIISNTNSDIYKEGYAIAENTGDGYWHEMFSGWWAQYSGIQECKDFYYGLVGNTQTSDVYKSKGRLRALEVFEQIFKPDKEASDYKFDDKKPVYKYIYPYANEASTDYMVVQTGFLAGKGVFHANGDWFETEMHTYREGFEEQGHVYNFKFMRLPIISTIVEQLPDKSVENDIELRALVRAIDNGNTELTGEGYSVTQADYNRVKEARCIVTTRYSSGARIPSYAAAKEVAIDFLRFGATDIAQEALMKKAYGLARPFQYDYTKNTEVYNAIADTNKSKLDMYYSTTLPMVSTPQKENFPYGIEQFNYYKMWSTTLEALFSSGKKNAADIYQEEIDYWNGAQTLWQQMIGSGQ